MNQQPGSISHHLFSYEGNLKGSGKPNGSLLTFSKTTVEPRSHYDFNVKADSSVFILPLEGKVVVTDDECKAVNTASNIFTSITKYNQKMMVTNPDKSRLNSFLTLEMAAIHSDIPSFELLKDNYQTIDFEESQPFKVHIGNFGCKVGGALKLAEKSNIFCFVIYGTIKIEDQILKDGGSLYLRNCEKIKTESLDENCVLLVLEEQNN